MMVKGSRIVPVDYAMRLITGTPMVPVFASMAPLIEKLVFRNRS